MYPNPGCTNKIGGKKKQEQLNKMKGLDGCFLKWWYPQNTPKSSFLVGKPMIVVYHHFRKHPDRSIGQIGTIHRVHAAKDTAPIAQRHGHQVLGTPSGRANPSLTRHLWAEHKNHKHGSHGDLKRGPLKGLWRVFITIPDYKRNHPGGDWNPGWRVDLS